jgi:hypothetical protein
VSRKRRENQQKRAGSEWTRTHYIVGAIVVVVSAAVAIAAFTIFVGSSFGENKGNLVDKLPALGKDLPADTSPASDALKKPWDETSPDDRKLIASEVTRVFSDAEFRASSGLVTGIDVKIAGGETQFSRSYAELQEPVRNMRFAESLVFYCPIGDGNVHYYKYLTSPDGTALSDVIQPDGTQPWETIVSRIDWSQDVVDLGLGQINGRRAHGYRVRFDFNQPDQPTTKKGDYWFDVENARLLARQEYIEGQNTQQTRYILQYRAFPPARVDDNLDQPDCVQDTLAKYGSTG